ncbi:MAG: DUF4013 domain-containing protein [Aggregatilineales bacterium]
MISTWTRAFTYPFRESRWLSKLGLLALIGCIPGLNLLAWVGYQLSIAHNRAHGASELLPAWDEWADILVRGLIGVSVSGMYLLPAIIGGLIGLLFTNARGIAWPLAIVLAAGGGIALIASHARYAHSDQPGEYGVSGWLTLFRGTRSGHSGAWLIAFAIGCACQIGVIAFATALTPLALLTLIGPALLWTAACTINGYLLGTITAVSSSAAIDSRHA